MASKEGLKRMRNVLFVLGAAVMGVIIKVQVSDHYDLLGEQADIMSLLTISDILPSLGIAIVPFGIGIYIVNGFIKSKDAEQDDPKSE